MEYYFFVSFHRHVVAPRPEDGVKWKMGSGRSQSYVEGSVGGLVLLTPWKIYTFGCSSVAAFCIFVFEWSFCCGLVWYERWHFFLSEFDKSNRLLDWKGAVTTSDDFWIIRIDRVFRVFFLYTSGREFTWDESKYSTFTYLIDDVIFY